MLRKGGSAPRHIEDGVVVGEGRSISLDDSRAPAGIAWYYAIFALRGIVPCPEPAVSGPHKLNLEAVTQLAARRSGSNLVLTWSWPPGIEECLVTWTYDRHAADALEATGGKARITRREYDHAGCWILSHVERLPHYLAVLAKVPGDDLYAPPARIVASMGQGLSVSYRVRVRRALLRRTVVEAWVELTCGASPSAELPALRMIGKRQSVPLSPEDGAVLAEAPSIRLVKGSARLPIPERHWADPLYVRLFFQDAEAAREIRLLPAAKESLRIA
jgi:hypothetical protein